MTLTPGEFAVTDAFTAVGFIGAAAGLAWLIFRWLPRKWREAAADLDDAKTLCLYCRGIDWCANCTCDRKCTAMVCLWGVKAAKGLDQ